MQDISEMMHVYDYDPYQVYASAIHTGLSNAFLSDIVTHDTVSNEYSNHVEGWFKDKKTAYLVFEVMLSKGYSYNQTQPGDSSYDTVKKIYNFDPESDESSEEGYFFVVFVPLNEKIKEDSQGNYYPVRGIH